MPNPFRKARESGSLPSMFETRSQAWADVGLEVGEDTAAVKSAWQRLVVCLLLLIAVCIFKGLALQHIRTLQSTVTGTDTHRYVRDHTTGDLVHPHTYGHWIVGETPVVIVAVLAFLFLGWFISRDLSRVSTSIFKRLDPATAGTVGFVIRFLAVAATLLGALAVANVSLTALAVGGSFTAIILGISAQQTLGNVFAGMVLLSAQPFRLGERIRLQAGATGGQLEGVVSSLGLLYTTLARGQDRIMIPNNVVIQAVVVPLREPTPVDVRITLKEGIKPSQVQGILDQELADATRQAPSVALEEIDGGQTVIRVRATPEDAADQARLADAIITVLANVTGEHEVTENGGPPEGEG